MKLLESYLDERYLSDRFSTVTPLGQFKPFEIRLSDGGKLQRRRARGKYERHVASYLNDSVDESTVFWDIGAAWGYFSLMVATRAERVVSIEAEADTSEMLRESVVRNGFENVTVVTESFSRDTDLDEFPRPSLVLIDIEGAEYDALRNLVDTFGPTMSIVVEVHDEIVGMEVEDSTAAIESYLVSIGFETRRLKRWTRKNPHVVAEPHTDA